MKVIYKARQVKNKWYTYNTETNRAIISCADKAEAQRYATVYNEREADAQEWLNHHKQY